MGEARAANEVALAAGLAPPGEATTRANLHPYDPEHLIVNGLGGAFLHPTHVFAPARFASVSTPAARMYVSGPKFWAEHVAGNLDSSILVRSSTACGLKQCCSTVIH